MVDWGKDECRCKKSKPEYDDTLLMYFCGNCHKHISLEKVSGGWERAYRDMGAFEQPSTIVVPEGVKLKGIPSHVKVKHPKDFKGGMKKK